MPDQEGEQKAGETPATPLHAYKSGREEDVEPGDLGTNPDGSRLPEEAGAPGSYQRGGHAEEPEDPEPVQTSPQSGEAGVADGALDDTVTHPDAGDQGLGSRTGGLDGPGE